MYYNKANAAFVGTCTEVPVNVQPKTLITTHVLLLRIRNWHTLAFWLRVNGGLICTLQPGKVSIFAFLLGHTPPFVILLYSWLKGVKDKRKI